MQDLVLIPTFSRPEMLWLCLDYLAASPDVQSVKIRVYVDAHVGNLPPKAEIETVLRKFPQLSIQVGFRPPHHFHGNSFNVLMAYKDAYDSDAQHVFLVEDDILVRPNFFAWHRQQHQRKIGCSIGVVKERQHGLYASLGSCFHREMIRLVLPHCKTEYFTNLRAYCKQKFPPAAWDCEQDGLWCRVLVDQPPVVWATTPVAQHVGWYGYHRKRSVRPTGTLKERYEQVKMVLSSPENLRLWSKDFGDVAPLQLVAKGR